jgi:hypothetical protein
MTTLLCKKNAKSKGAMTGCNLPISKATAKNDCFADDDDDDDDDASCVLSFIAHEYQEVIIVSGNYSTEMPSGLSHWSCSECRPLVLRGSLGALITDICLCTRIMYLCLY